MRRTLAWILLALSLGVLVPLAATTPASAGRGDFDSFGVAVRGN